VTTSNSPIRASADDSFGDLSLALEKALVESDYALLSVLKEISPQELSEGLRQLEEKISQNGAKGDLDTLCSASCNREDLLWLSQWFSNETIFQSNEGWMYKPGERTTEAMLGMHSKKLRKLVTQLNKVAVDVERVNRHFQFGVLLSTSRSLSPLWSLQGLLRVYARLLRYATRHFGSGTHTYHNIAKARLTTYIKSRTGNFHDKEVAALISSLSGDEGCYYDATAHSVWRRKHYRRLKDVDPSLVSEGPITGLVRHS